MKLFQKIVGKYQKRYNFFFLVQHLIIIVSLYLVLLNIYYLAHAMTNVRFYELFLFGLSLRITFGLLIIFLILKAYHGLISDKQAARHLDLYNHDKHDTYQNALELLEKNEGKDQDVLQLLFAQADKKAEKQNVKPGTQKLKAIFTPFIFIVAVTLIFLIMATDSYLDSWHWFAKNSVRQPEYSSYIELVPGDVSLSRGSPVEIGIIEPDQNLSYTLHYRFDESWRTETLYQNKKVFPGLDYDVYYYVTNPHAVSDTFKITVFEEPAVRDMTVRYNFPAYTGLESEVDYQSSGNIRAIEGSEISVEIEANNPLEEAIMIFSDGNIKNMERLGRNTFDTSFEVEKSGSYHFLLTDFLGNKSQRLEKNITMISDRMPDLKIVYPGKDTLFTQNLKQPMKFFATDDFGLQNLNLFYRINENEVITQVLQKNIPVSTFEYDYVFDLSNTYMLPGDIVTYWAEVSDNKPERQTAQSRTFTLRFPSVEEIFAEIQREEEQKMEDFRKSIEMSEQLQQDFEHTRREMMKQDEYDWEEKMKLESHLSQQEDLNQMIENIADEYQNLLEKFEDNPFLSQETLDKMQRIKELMEEIADENMREVMEKMRNAMEEMNRDEIMKLMDEFKFSMEEFNRKLENTLALLEDIKKEQSLQKALAISEEMEQMQEKLMERTSQQEADAESLAKEQDNIGEKMDALEEQIENTKQMLDENKDKNLLSELNSLQDEMQQDNMQGDMEASSEQLRNEDFTEAMSSQNQAKQKMSKVSRKLSEMNESMMGGGMEEMTEAIQETILRLYALSLEHQIVSGRYAQDPFPIYPDLIAGYDSIQLTLQKLYSSPQIVLFITPKFVMDADMTLKTYREMFNQIINTRNPNIRNHLANVQKGINLMIYNLMMTMDNMSQSPGGGMQSLMQSMQQMGQEQMTMNMITQQLMDQMGGRDGYTQEMRQQMQRLARDEQRLADNLRRLMETNPEAQRQANAINQMIEELESVSRQLRQNRLDETLIHRQERILSRMLDAQKSINQREFSRRRRGETREDEEWEIPENVLQEFQRLRQQALLRDNYRSYPQEYQDLIREYLRRLNIRAIENE
jgi:hypothetical protein